jgi:GTP-binding protein
MLIRSAIFVKSASKLAECPISDLPEFAMIGRSNVGKSSLINTIANNSKLSKISIKPGKTTLINFFLINGEWHLVDLPGYGFAKSGTEHRATWIDTTHDYFVGRPNLKKVFVLIDGSIAPQEIDIEFVASLDQEKIPYAIVLTKLDKSNQKEAARHQRELLEQLSVSVSKIPEIFAVSNKTKRGREELLEYIEELIGER